MYEKQYACYKEAIENKLSEYMNNNDIEPLLREAMAYSLLQGGKRLRPVLTLASNRLISKDFDECLPDCLCS